MVSHSSTNAEGASSQEGAAPSLTISDLLFALGQLMLRTGCDFPVSLGRAQALQSVLIPPIATGSPTELAGSPRDAPVIPATEAPESQPDTVVADLAQGMAAVSVNGVSNSDSPAAMATESEGTGTGDVSSAVDSVDGDIEDDNTADPNDPTVRWYAVTTGLRVGVFAHWPSVAPFVVGIKGACFVRYNTRAEARAAFFDAISRGGVRVVPAPGALYPTLNSGLGSNVPDHDNGGAGSGGGNAVSA